MLSEIPVIVWVAIVAVVIAYFVYLVKSPNHFLTGAIVLFWLVIVEPAPCDVFAGLGALAWFFHSAAIRKAPPGLSLAEALILLFALVNGATILLGPADSPKVDVFRFVSITLYLVIFSVVVSQVVDGFDSLRRVTGIYLIPCLITAWVLMLGFCLEILQFDLFGLKDVIVLEMRPRGFFKDPNVAGPSLILGGLFCLAKVVYGEGKRFSWHVFFLGLFSGGILVTMSRAAIGSFALGAVFVMVMSGKLFTFRLLGRAVAAVLIAVAVLWYFVGVDDVTGRIVDRTFGIDSRVQRINYGLDILSGHALIGVGMGLNLDKAPHDSYFFVLAQSGVVGFVLLWGPLCCIVLNLVRMSRVPGGTAEKAVLLALTGSMLAHLLIGTVVYILHWRHFWLLVGLSVAALRAVDRSSADEVWELSR
jgi:hypothetical protein